MTDNFKAIRDLLNFSDKDKFYLLQIFKRRKDNPGMKKDMTILDSFFISSLDQYDEMEEKIKKICIDNNARAYFRLNRRSFKQVALRTLGRIAKMIEDENYEHVKRAYLSCAGEFHKEEDKTWIVDLDRNGASDEDFDSYVNNVSFEVQKLIQETGKDDSIVVVPTKNGLHLVCRPFNISKFRGKISDVDIHKDNPLVLFCP
jgi:hypothetical protein